jgi:hypothetical protein
MAGTFDSPVASFDLYKSTVASNASVTSPPKIANFVAPYDLEILAGSISALTASTGAYLWANIKATDPAGNTVTLFARPSAPAVITKAQVDQSYLTVVTTAPAVASTTPTSAVSTTLVAVSATDNIKVGQGVAGAKVPVGTRVTALSAASGAGNVTVELPQNADGTYPNLTLATTDTIAFFTAPTPIPNQTVLFQNLPAPFNGVNSAYGYGDGRSVTWQVVDSSHSVTAQTVKVGPLTQASQYSNTSGFWNFTVAQTAVATGQIQIVEAPVLASTTANSGSVFNYPDKKAVIAKGSVVFVEASAITTGFTGIAATAAADWADVSVRLTTRKV